MKLSGQAGRQASKIFEGFFNLFSPFSAPLTAPSLRFLLNLFANRSDFIALFPAPAAQLLGGSPSFCTGKNNLGGEKWRKRTM